jgi:tRNA pseudouridine55 synthase
LISGLVVVDKPAGWTSHDVVARCRKVFGQRRVGHAGTLDPDATGVLLVGLGRVTRLLRFLAELPKSYTGEVVLGVETSTLDAAGEVTATCEMGSVTDEDIRAACEVFNGPIEQVPPMVSAIKIGGQRLHQLARQGVEVERPARHVTIYRLVPGSIVDGVFRIDVECSAGTYVRSLASDLGRALGGGAHLRALRRLAIGPFAIADTVPLDQLGGEHVLPPLAVLRGRPTICVTGEAAAAVAHGRALPGPVVEVGPVGVGPVGVGPVGIVDESGELLAVYEPAADGTLKPAVVLAG